MKNMNIQSLNLFHQKALIAGEWQEANNGNTIEVINPATSEVIGTVPNMGRAETEVAIELAHKGWKGWANKTAKERSNVLLKWYELVIENQSDLARILTTEQGKPLSEAVGEIQYAASFIQWFAEEAKRAYGDIIPSPYQNSQIVVTKHPIGIIAAITPWNFPAAMITRKIAPALAAGCPCIVKPALETPYTAFALMDLAIKAGVPKEILSVITGDPAEIGEAFFDSKLVRKLSFTGSTPIGKLLYEKSAKTLKKVALELGGNAPFIVFDDANLHDAVDGALIAKFRNAGQTCVCVNRFYVHEHIYEEFIKLLSQKVSGLKIGNGLDNGITIGPLITEKAISKVQSHVDDAVSKNARLILGGMQTEQVNGCFYPPTIIADVNQDMLVAKDETFGPLAAVFKFQTEEEVIELANNTDSGLAAYCYTNNLGRAWRLSQCLEYGMVGINSGVISNEVAPFGGTKYSGLGREGSKYGLEEFLEIKYTLFSGLLDK